MQLNVSLYRDGEKLTLSRDALIEFDDADKIGIQVGRAVRDWLRQRPVRASGTRTRFDVHAWWTMGDQHNPAAEGVETVDHSPKRRRRKRAA